jgi:type II restriction enzyme
MNLNVPVLKKNVDLSILRGNTEDLRRGTKSIIHDNTKYIALGELKGGIDPAGADEHWKTANSALNRIRSSFYKMKLKPQTFFIGAAIESSMASEIFKQLRSDILSNSANLTSVEQLAAICDWIVNL